MSRPRDNVAASRLTRGPASFAGAVVSCEHASRAVPTRYRALFADADALLRSHRGWDPGALPMARSIAARLDAPLVAGHATRLLVDLNRAPGHAQVLSERVRSLPAHERDLLLRTHHAPFREALHAHVTSCIGLGAVLHLSVHSFTPVLAGVTRNAELGLLYDPSRAGERSAATYMVERLRDIAPSLRVRRNYPYRGTADGTTSWLRTLFGADRYVGLEIEINQAAWASAHRPVLAAALLEVCGALRRLGRGD